MTAPAVMTPPAVVARMAVRDVAHPMRPVIAVVPRIAIVAVAVVARVAVNDAPHVGPVIITVVDRAIPVAVAVRAMAVAVIAAVAEAETDRQTAGLGRKGGG